jgi:thiamine biosynthesis lipoprotein
MASHRVIPVMGTVFSVELLDGGAELIDSLAAYWHQVDATFSTYREGSDINRLTRGECRLADVHPDVATVLDLAAAAHTATGGYFSATAGGRLDPSGVVKGWSVEQAAGKLTSAGCGNFFINGGGDVKVLGKPGAAGGWGVGIADPDRPGALLAVLTSTALAVATSGIAERGRHVLNPFTGGPATGLRSVTVAGPSLTWADVYATAALAMGAPAREWLESLPGYCALGVGEDGEVWTTPGFRLASSAAAMVGTQ